MIPVLFSIVSVVGLAAVILGFVGFVRAGRSAAFSGGLGLAGAVLGLAAMVLATWGLAITVSAQNDPAAQQASAEGGTAPQLDQVIESMAASPEATEPAPTDSESVSSESTSSQPTESSERTPIPLGAVAQRPPFTLRILSVDRRPTVSSSLSSYTAQGSYVIVRIQAENIGNSPAKFEGEKSRLLDADGKQYNAYFDATSSLSIAAGTGVYEEINPGQKITRVLVFDLPKKATPTVLAISDDGDSYGPFMSLTKDNASANG